MSIRTSDGFYLPLLILIPHDLLLGFGEPVHLLLLRLELHLHLSLHPLLLQLFSGALAVLVAGGFLGLVVGLVL